MKTCQIITSNAPSSKKPYYIYLDKEFQHTIGYNTGNILICDYATKQLNYKFKYQFYWELDCDEYLILAANDLRPGYEIDYTAWFDFLAKLKKPLNIMGLGTQVPLEGMNAQEYASNLPIDMKRWIKMLADQCTSIGVRGEFTADVLAKLGIQNVDVIGCPTWFVNGMHQPIIKKLEWNTSLKTAFYTCWEAYSTWHTRWHRTLLENVLPLQDPKFVIQSEFDFVPYLLAHKDMMQFLLHCSMEDFTRSAQAIQTYFQLDEYAIYQNKKIRNMFEIFSDIETWENFVKTRDFSFGFRIHGSIIALKNGIPAICIVSDSRMYEMCQLFHIPFVRVDQLESQHFNLEKIYTEADFSNLNTSYSKLLSNYIHFLNKNKIQHKF